MGLAWIPGPRKSRSTKVEGGATKTCTKKSCFPIVSSGDTLILVRYPGSGTKRAVRYAVYYPPSNLCEKVIRLGVEFEFDYSLHSTEHDHDASGIVGIVGI